MTREHEGRGRKDQNPDGDPVGGGAVHHPGEQRAQLMEEQGKDQAGSGDP